MLGVMIRRFSFGKPTHLIRQGLEKKANLLAYPYYISGIPIIWIYLAKI